MSDAVNSAKLSYQGKTYDLPGIKGALGPDVIDISKVRVLPPLTAPGKIICVGLNYEEHLKETYV